LVINEVDDFSSLLSYYGVMPAISIFFGIVIKMYYDDHRPPHFHAEYQGQKGAFDFSGRQIAGNIGSTVALRLIKEWAVRHKHELMVNWKRIEARKPLNLIEPLE
jgi:hypothetical protein